MVVNTQGYRLSRTEYLSSLDHDIVGSSVIAYRAIMTTGSSSVHIANEV
jgi:hypothetical protein